MNRRKLIIIAAALIAFFSAVQIAIAAEGGSDFNALVGIRENLLANVGKRVAVRISDGDAIEGTIAKVGDQLVQLTRLAGKDFFDAIVRIDRIDAITFKAR